jgi:DNA-binding transcriptional regulator YhcF (GntR family)
MARGAVDKPDGSTVAAISVDRDAEVPIGVQLVWALRSRIGDGRLSPGMRLPGLRELADITGVNVNTVRAVYQRLEQDGLIDTQHGSGTYVSARPPSPSAAGNIAAQAASEARETGVDPRAVAAALYVSAEEPAHSADEGRQRRRLLRAQIATLERTLGEMEATHPGLAPPPSKRRRSGGGPALLSAAELEGVRGQLVRRLADVQAAIDARDTTGGPPRAKPAPSTRPAKVPAQPKASPAKRPSTRPAIAGA